jgi:hypothetical protein
MSGSLLGALHSFGRGRLHKEVRILEHNSVRGRLETPCKFTVRWAGWARTKIRSSSQYFGSYEILQES